MKLRLIECMTYPAVTFCQTLEALYPLPNKTPESQTRTDSRSSAFWARCLKAVCPKPYTVSLFQKRLVQTKAIDKPFAHFDATLANRGYWPVGGQPIDATVVPPPPKKNSVH